VVLARRVIGITVRVEAASADSYILGVFFHLAHVFMILPPVYNL
jgi:hypothetical protein